MKKVIAKEVNPAHVDFSYYFDNDGLKSIGGENCAVYIVPADRRRNSGFNMDEYRETERLKARDLQLTMARRRQVRGSIKDYVTVYRDFCRADGDWSSSRRTRLYTKHGGEYCELLEILEFFYSDHVLSENPGPFFQGGVKSEGLC
jgi:hypothetical protein